MPALSEERGSAAAQASGVYFAGESVPPWQLFVDDAANAASRVAATGTSARGTVKVEPLPRDGASTARLVTWSGSGRGDIFLASEQAADLARESNGDMAIEFEVSPRKLPSGVVTMSVRCGNQCGASVDVAPLLRNAPAGQWSRIRVRLRCFADRGADMKRIESPFRLSADGEMQLALGEVKLVPADGSVKCPE